MKIFLVWFFSLLLAGVIISPFLWLKFLRVKSSVKYLVASSTVTLVFFWFSLTWAYKFVLSYVNSYDVLYYFDGISMYFIYIVIFLIIVSPFIFTKINKTSFSLRRFLVDLLLSGFIFVAIFLYWAYVLLPKAFQDLHNHF
jgi:hypothetical protein